MRRFEVEFRLTDDLRILDVGGYPTTWETVSSRPWVTLVNLHPLGLGHGRMEMVVADGRNLPFRDGAFSICFSNSVIEHVGEWSNVVEFAAEIRRVAPRYYVQTPNRHFPIEPHMLGLFVQYFPRRLLRRVARYFTLWGLVRKPNQQQIDAMLEEINLLTDRQMRELFPDARIERETVFGLTKSLIAIKA